MADAIKPLANITLSSSASTVTFSSISGAYRDLLLIGSNLQTSSGTGDVMRCRINNDSGSNYSWVYMGANGSSSGSSSSSGQSEATINPNNSAGSSTSPGMLQMHFLDYTATDKHKTFISRTDAAASTYPGTNASANRWSSTSAITEIKIYINGFSFAAGSSFSLYGVSA